MLKKIILLDVYIKLCEILQTISNKYKLDYEELKELYLKDLDLASKVIEN